MTLQEYIDNLDKRYKTGISKEHSYRGDLQQLLTDLTKNILVTNEPARVECGAPDYILTKKGIPVGYIEAKDIGKSLDSKDYEEQFNRYRKGLDNLIITDYLEFRWYKEGEPVQKVQIAEALDGQIKTLPKNFKEFEDMIADFTLTHSLSIRSANKLADMMAGKARMLDNVITNALLKDDDAEINSNLYGQFGAFRRVLLHDLTVPEFADIYSQTVTYGMFAARLHDETPDDFSRQEAAELIPKTNPFLRWLFADIAGPNIDERIVWIVDALGDIFRHTDMDAVLKDFGKATGQNDPLVHFYEPFLAAYNPDLRKSRGVWYTPQPVVNFMVRAVDDILKSEFRLSQGLADTSTVKVKYKATTKATADRRSKTREVEAEKEVHRVQILDPATGTGTFLAEVIRQIHGKFKGIEGMWPDYVEKHLLPRLNGFELLMASYAMAHLKLDMVLRETGVDTTRLGKRLRVFLTNSLEEADEQMPDLFSQQLANEASQANHIKRETPVMVVLGNPPYAVSSTNKSEWIQRLISDYKKGLNERKINLDDDYIKFIRYGQHFIDKNGEGVLAFISNSSFIDGITHRQMRKHLMESFDKIYILDLHGDSKKGEKAPDGGKDENVFDIMQGVSINIFIKTKAQKKDCKVFISDLYGRRNTKYKKLSEINLSTTDWKPLNLKAPNYFFVEKDFALAEEYNAGLKLTELMPVYSSGVETQKDAVCIHFNQSGIKNVMKDFSSLEEEEVKYKYGIKKEGRDWKVKWAIEDLSNEGRNISSISFRPFDNRYTVLTPRSKGFMAYPRYEVMQHLNIGKNVGILAARQTSQDYRHVFIANRPTDGNLTSTAKKFGSAPIFPLYLYPDTSQTSTEGNGTKPNIDKKLAQQMAEGMGCHYLFEEARAWEHGQKGELLPLDILDYTYAVLHSPTYREKYKEFLKIDFPRVPFPEDEEKFRQLVELGAELRQIHLMEHPVLEEKRGTIGYPQTGDNVVSRKMTKTSPGFVLSGASDAGTKRTQKKQERKITSPPQADRNDATGKVWINDEQYFDNVPQAAWEFYIGGYQPAQKWLKDRKDRKLEFDDILHYRKIIVALSETDRLMKEINKTEIE